MAAANFQEEFTAQRRASLSEQRCWICDNYIGILWAERWNCRRTWARFRLMTSEGTDVGTTPGCCWVECVGETLSQNYVAILLPWIFKSQSGSGSSVFTCAPNRSCTTAILPACLLSQLSESPSADLNPCLKTVAATWDVKVNADPKRTSRGKKAGTPGPGHHASPKT